MARRFAIGFLTLALGLGLAAAQDAPWPWSGGFGDDTTTLVILGDIQVHTRRPDPVTAFVHLRPTLQAADLVYANLEGVLVQSVGPDIDIPDKKGWTNPGPGGAKALTAANIAAVGLANNVAYGRDNILATIKVLDAHGIRHVGAGRDLDEAHRPLIVERDGIKIGFLQYTARWYRADHQLATATAAGVASITSRDGKTIDAADLARLQQDVRALRAQADIVVVSHHNRDGATPVQFGPPAPRAADAPRPDRSRSEPYQRQFAHTAIDAGADLVFGHGTHYVQGVERYKGRPILYAIGHSAFDQPGYEDSKDGLVIRAVLRGNALLRVSFVPVSRDADNNVLLLDPKSGDGAALLAHVTARSPGTPLSVDGSEVVLIDNRGATVNRAGRR